MSKMSEVQLECGVFCTPMLFTLKTEVLSNVYVEYTQNHSVTAACLYPALRLDKLYAALIRCLVLWTVTKQLLVFVF